MVREDVEARGSDLGLYLRKKRVKLQPLLRVEAGLVTGSQPSAPAHNHSSTMQNLKLRRIYCVTASVYTIQNTDVIQYVLCYDHLTTPHAVYTLL